MRPALQRERSGVPVHNPGTGIVSDESNSDVIVGLTNADNISLHGVDIVVSAASGAADDMEGVLMKRLNRSANTNVIQRNLLRANG